MADKVVMVLERADASLDIQKKGDSYVLQGTFTKFGTENENHRIYEEKEFMPHLEALQKQIRVGSLYGELDHPEKFDISLTKVSHLIEKLEYDSEKRAITGRIRILNTEAGKNAKAILDDGGLLSISSRAAGTVQENKKVQIKKVFTYDLVGAGGFGVEAQLERINESLGFDENDTNIDIYDMTDKYPHFFESVNTSNIETETKKENNIKATPMNENQFVTVEALHKYSEYIKEKFEELETLLKSSDAPLSSKTSSDVENLKEYAQYLGEQTQKLVDYTEYVAENTGSTIEFTNYLAENLDKSIQHNDYITENLNNVIKYNEYLAENLDENISESQNLIKYGEYLGKKLDEGIQYSEYIKENAENIIKHNDYLAENLNNSINYQDYLGENLNTSVNYQNYLAENLNSAVNYADYLGENLNDVASGTLNESKSTTVKEVLTSSKNLSARVDDILNSVKKQQTELTESKVQFPYLTLLGEKKQKEFALLEAAKKQKVMQEVNRVKPLNESQFVETWSTALDPKAQTIQLHERLLSEMPAKMKPIWENLAQDKKEKILANSNNFKLDTAYQIRDFWNSKTSLTEALELQKLNESVNVDEEKEKVNTLGYGNAFMNNVAASLDKYNNRY